LQFFANTLTKISKNNPQLKNNELPYCYLWSNYDVHRIQMRHKIGSSFDWIVVGRPTNIKTK
jgi:hypothetical protein